MFILSYDHFWALGGSVECVVAADKGGTKKMCKFWRGPLFLKFEEILFYGERESAKERKSITSLLSSSLSPTQKQQFSVASRNHTHVMDFPFPCQCHCECTLGTKHPHRSFVHIFIISVRCMDTDIICHLKTVISGTVGLDLDLEHGCNTL